MSEELKPMTINLPSIDQIRAREVEQLREQVKRLMDLAEQQQNEIDSLKRRVRYIEMRG